VTKTELLLAVLGVLMLATCGLVYHRTRSASVLFGVVIVFMLVANRLGLLI
jgi:hypothetical protein